MQRQPGLLRIKILVRVQVNLRIVTQQKLNQKDRVSLQKKLIQSVKRGLKKDLMLGGKFLMTSKLQRDSTLSLLKFRKRTRIIHKVDIQRKQNQRFNNQNRRLPNQNNKNSRFLSLKKRYRNLNSPNHRRL